MVKTDDNRFPVADSSIDLLLAYEVEPVTNSPWFVSEAARVLERDGVLVCTVNNPASIRGVVYRARMPVSPSRRRNRAYEGPSFQRFRRELVAHGFEFLLKEGLAWAPFPRDSNSRLIPYVSGLERVIGLRRLVRFGPRVVIVARRTATRTLAEPRLQESFRQR
jgi:hypothetical protein